MADDPKQSIEIPSSILRAIDRHGWPTVLVFALVFGIWNFSTWLSPKLDLAIKKHFDTVDSMVETQAMQVENGKKLVTIAEAESEKTKEIRDKVSEVHRVVVGSGSPPTRSAKGD